MSHLKVIAHRGASAYEPENTMRSFTRALDMGADILELDIFALVTGELVVIHDRTVDRTTDGHGYVLLHSFRALRRLDAGMGEQIPTLQEVLDMVDKRVPVIIELKNVGSAEIVAKVINDYVLHKGWRYDQLIVHSFIHPELVAFKKHIPQANVSVGIAHMPLDGAAIAEQLNAVAIVPDMDALDSTLIDDAHRRGVEVYAYTISTYEHTAEMVQLGLDGVITDAPDISLQAKIAVEAGDRPSKSRNRLDIVGR